MLRILIATKIMIKIKIIVITITKVFIQSIILLEKNEPRLKTIQIYYTIHYLITLFNKLKSKIHCETHHCIGNLMAHLFSHCKKLFLLPFVKKDQKLDFLRKKIKLICLLQLTLKDKVLNIIT